MDKLVAPTLSDPPAMQAKPPPINLEKIKNRTVFYGKGAQCLYESVYCG